MGAFESRADLMVIQWNAGKYGPVGRCIYCGSTTDLTDEHILPFALHPKGGDWFLPKSSCLACADITKRFEQVVLRGMFGPLREQMGLKSRRKRTGNILVRYNYPDGSLRDEEVGVMEFPRLCLGFKWPIPGILLGHTPTNIITGELVMKYDEHAFKKHATHTDAFRVGRVGPMHFARMLAKIAHAYAVAEYGFESFDPLLPPLILGDSDHAPYLVGGDYSAVVENKPPMLHYIRRTDCHSSDIGVKYFGVSIQLFAIFGMPMYHVIVGRRLKEGPPERKIGGTVAVQLPVGLR